jgi:hypothetical protein
MILYWSPDAWRQTIEQTGIADARDCVAWEAGDFHLAGSGCWSQGSVRSRLRRIQYSWQGNIVTRDLAMDRLQ